MSITATARATAIAAAPLAATWDIAVPLTPVGFYPRSGLLPAVVEVVGQTGPWDAAGQTRTLRLSDGSSVVETIVLAEEPHRFHYELSSFTRLFGVLVESGRAEWTYAEHSAGTLIDWTYTFRARRLTGPVVRGIVRLLWGPYMRRVLPGIVTEVERRVRSGR